MNQDLAQHYSRLADTYDAAWGHRPDYLDWMEERIGARLGLRPGDRIADVGAGTGLFLRRLTAYATAETPVVCVDPSRPMLDRLPRDPRLLPVCATAEEWAHRPGATLPRTADMADASGGARPAGAGGRFDAVLVKEAVHHFADLPGTLAGLAGRLAPGGRLLIVTLPPEPEYPLFRRALARFAENQPEPRAVEAALRDAGLAATTSYEAFRVRIDLDHWLSLVEGRWMSVLSTFSEAELADGLAEIAENAVPDAEGRLEFADRFAFVEGRAPGGPRTRSGGPR